MTDLTLIHELATKNSRKIVLLVMDGLGGVPLEPGGPTELEAASKPNLDILANEGCLGQSLPIRHGITPGSGPAHLSLFGYDPLQYVVGRGVLEAIGVGMEVRPGDVAARGNFCTLDPSGNITDRRAGRIGSLEAAPIVQRLAGIRIPSVTAEVRQVKEYRFAVVLRGESLHPDIADTDPQKVGVPPLPARATAEAAGRTADLFNQWIESAKPLLATEPKANGLTLRGFSTDPRLPRFPDIFGLRSACVAVYPMYKGVARLVGMDVLPVSGETPDDEFRVVAEAWNSYDFFFIHIKKTDSTGEDGKFEEKVKVIEAVDAALSRLLGLKPDVLVVTGDHSTPSKIKTHTWHPVPFLLWAPATVRPDDQIAFGERACSHGGLGTVLATDLMPLMMAHAEKLGKYGA